MYGKNSMNNAKTPPGTVATQPGQPNYTIGLSALPEGTLGSAVTPPPPPAMRTSPLNFHAADSGYFPGSATGLGAASRQNFINSFGNTAGGGY